MCTNDLISIIVPVYNPGKLFIKCIESCLHQTYSNLEIILVDDCSTDPYTIELLDHYAQLDQRIRILRPEHNIGQGACRNLGEAACNGKYLTFLDNDDSFALTFIERTHDAIVQHQTDMVIADVCYYGDDQYYKDYGLVLQHSIFKAPLAFNLPIPFSLLVNNGGFYILPWEVHAKLFNTASYRAANLKLSEEAELRSVEDILWFTQVQLRLKNFTMIPCVGMFRLMHSQSDSVKPFDPLHVQRYFTAIINRQLILQKFNLAHLYQTYFYWQMMDGVKSLVLTQKSYQERRSTLSDSFPMLNKWIQQDFSRFTPDFDGDQSSKWQIFYQVLFDHATRPQLWWISLSCTHDVSSDCQFTPRHLLAGLADLGYQVTAISAPFFKQSKGDNLLKKILDNQDATADKLPQLAQPPALAFVDHAYDCRVLNLKHKTLDSLQNGDLVKFIEQLYAVILTLPKPDRILVTGSDPLSLALFARLKQSDYQLTYVACGQESGFEQAVTQGLNLADYFDACCALTNELAQNCQTYLPMPISVLGWLTRSSYLKKPYVEQKSILVPSLALQHGLAIVLKLALILHKECIKFVLVMPAESTLQHDIAQLHYADGTKLLDQRPNLSNLEIVHQPCNMDQLYDRSSLMLLPYITPSLSQELIAQALVFSVPVLTSERAPYSEYFKQVDYLPVPATCSTDYTCLPSDAEIEPYVTAIHDRLEHQPLPIDAFSGFYELDQVRTNWQEFLDKNLQG